MKKVLIIESDQRNNWMKGVVLCAAQKHCFGCYYITKEKNKFALYTHHSDGTPKYADLEEVYYGLKTSKNLTNLLEYINHCNFFWFFNNGEVANSRGMSLAEALNVAKQYQ